MSAARFLIIFLGSVIVCTSRADPPVLRDMVVAWPRYHFTLDGDLNASYVIESSTNLVNWQAVDTNSYPGTTRTIWFEEFFAWKRKQFFRAWRLPQPVFRHAIAGLTKLDFNNNGPTVDSFDSGDPAFSTDGRYDPAKNKDGGDVATFSNLFYSLDIGNAKVMGHVAPGEALVLGPNGSIGSKAWVEANTGIEPGWVTDDTGLNGYWVVAPFTNAPAPLSGTIDGVTYAYVLESGSYLLPSLSVSSSDRMRVTGHSVLCVQNNILISSGGLEIDEQASLKLYAGGDSTHITGGGVVNKSGKAVSFQYYGLPRNLSLWVYNEPTITNRSLIGTICAPDAHLEMNPYGNDSFHFSGAIVIKNARIFNSCHLHFDESLLRGGPWR